MAEIESSFWNELPPLSPPLAPAGIPVSFSQHPDSLTFFQLSAKKQERVNEHCIYERVCQQDL